MSAHVFDGQPGQASSDNSSSSEEVNFEDKNEIQLCNVAACAVEVKSQSITNKAIKECFFNMFGSGTRLATMMLQMGNVVTIVSMYRIVVSMEDPNNDIILKMDMKFSQGFCYYWCVKRLLPFVDAVNIILTKLQNN